MKYNVGDRVRIKNFDWFRNEGANMVVVYMTKYYGEVVTIKSIHNGFYRIKEDGGQYCWIDEMFECKMEEETKSHNNMCKQLIDEMNPNVEVNVKTKPELNFKVGDKVRIKSIDWYILNKDKDGFVHCGDSVFDNYMSVFCGSVVTIGGVSLYGYDILEDMHCRTWTDEMIKGLVEEETKPKFKAGDKITNGKAILTILNLLSEKYVVKDNFGECGILYFNSQDEWKIVEEETKPKYEDEVNGEYYSTPKYLVRPSGYQFKDENGNVINATKIVLEKLVVPKFKKGDKIKDKNNRVWYVEQVGKKHFDISRIPNGGSGYFVPIEDQDYYELVPDIELPKTFEECVSVLMREGGNRMSLEQMNTFRKLIDARNAYWTIYGKENGLEKPWEPDYKNEYQKKYCIYNNKGDITKSVLYSANAILSFPTEEMRDTFYENFKSEIESCKEFL